MRWRHFAIGFIAVFVALGLLMIASTVEHRAQQHAETRR